MELTIVYMLPEEPRPGLSSNVKLAHFLHTSISRYIVQRPVTCVSLLSPSCGMSAKTLYFLLSFTLLKFIS